jgi:hypothetical protein
MKIILKLNSIKLNPKQLCSYEAFFDIEFNSAKSINCKVRTYAIFLSLIKQNKIKEALSSKENFIEIFLLLRLSDNLSIITSK